MVKYLIHGKSGALPVEKSGLPSPFLSGARIENLSQSAPHVCLAGREEPSRIISARINNFRVLHPTTSPKSIPPTSIAFLPIHQSPSLYRHNVCPSFLRYCQVVKRRRSSLLKLQKAPAGCVQKLTISSCSPRTSTTSPPPPLS